MLIMLDTPEGGDHSRLESYWGEYIIRVFSVNDKEKEKTFVDGDGDGDGEYLIITNGCLGFYLDALYRSVFPPLFFQLLMFLNPLRVFSF